MIDTATLQNTTIPADILILIGILLTILLLGVHIAAWLKSGRSYFLYSSATVTVTTAIFAFSILVVAALLVVSKSTDDKILVFDNNTGHIQAVKGEKPIGQVLERSKTRIVSTPCVFVANKEKQRHDCTFVNRGKGSFEVWDTATFRQTHPRP